MKVREESRHIKSVVRTLFPIWKRKRKSLSSEIRRERHVLEPYRETVIADYNSGMTFDKISKKYGSTIGQVSYFIRCLNDITKRSGVFIPHKNELVIPGVRSIRIKP